MGEGTALTGKQVYAYDLVDKSKAYQIVHPEPEFEYKYQATAEADVVVKASPGFLHRIIVGTGGTGTIEVSDHVSDGDGAVRILLTNPPTGSYEVNAKFRTGITSDITTVTNITFVYR